jgi:hypothetical protein
MLVKYPGLTIVGGLAMAFAIWAGVVTFVLVGQFVNPSLPLPDGDRIVQIRNWDAAENDPEPRVLSDFLVWRDALRSITDLGAYRNVSRNLIVGNDVGRTVQLGDEHTTVVGVMPEGFEFPVSHELWTPLRPDAIGHAPREGPGMGPLPFWFGLSLSPAAVLYACALTLLGAAIAGMVPARKITRGWARA